MPTALQSQIAMTETTRNGRETRSGQESHATGWFRATAPLWPLGLARILYGYLWWQQSSWKVPSDDFGRKSGGGLWYWVHQEIILRVERSGQSGAHGHGQRATGWRSLARAAQVMCIS